MRQEVQKEFDTFLIHTFKNESIRNYLINHERKERVIDRVCDQIEQCERAVFSIKFDAYKYRTVIYECAKLFSDTALKHAEEKALSYAEKQRRIHEADHIKRCEEFMVDMDKEAKSIKLVSTPGSVCQ